MTEYATGIDATHSPDIQSWVEGADDPDTDFPPQNLPLARFRRSSTEDWQIGCAIADQILDLQGCGLVDTSDMNELMSRGRGYSSLLRASISAGLSRGSVEESNWKRHLVAQQSVELGLPCRIGDYTDFYIGIEHARNVGQLFRPEAPLLPNYKWIPIGYHGRSSSIQVSPDTVLRPRGQTRPIGDEPPVVHPSVALDFELELAVFIGSANARGVPVPIEVAEQNLFGVALLNDWSARDIQSWEYQPLGPFLAKNFATTVSPWVVTMDALAPFRHSISRPIGDPDPLPHLYSEQNERSGGVDIQLEVVLQTSRMRDVEAAGEVIANSGLRNAYWTLAQLVAHHTSNGCNLQPGDLLGTGTLSGSHPHELGSLMEMSNGGQVPIELTSGETRTYLLDGDRITLRGYCEREGFRRIGFGQCVGTITSSPQ